MDVLICSRYALRLHVLRAPRIDHSCSCNDIHNFKRFPLQPAPVEQAVGDDEPPCPPLIDDGNVVPLEPSQTNKLLVAEGNLERHVAHALGDKKFVARWVEKSQVDVNGTTREILEAADVGTVNVGDSITARPHGAPCTIYEFSDDLLLRQVDR